VPCNFKPEKIFYRTMLKITYPAITLKKGREEAILRGHPWIFSGAITKVTGNPGVGDIVLAKDSAGNNLALGFYNPSTDIAFRVLTRKCEDNVSPYFWQSRLHDACKLRQKIIGDHTNAYRLINAEGDGFPGLIVDVYNTTLVISIATAGMEKQKSHLLNALVAQLKPTKIYEMSDSRSRRLEGLDSNNEVLFGESTNGTVEILENDLRFEVDIVSGQKTGFFLDQRLNREKLGALSRDAQVMNCFCYTGAFSVYCAEGGAKRVVSLDISHSACIAARKNLHLNWFTVENYPVIETDVFDYLRNTSENFSLIILDPPAFAKTKKDVAKASRGYKDINLQALKHLTKGGMLATFSCSNFIEEDLFNKIVLAAARDAGAEIQLLSRLEAGPDHPTLFGHPEGRYLKGLLLVKRN